MSPRVLMVDDEEDLVWTTARQVGRERPDLTFEGVTDPREALERIRRAPPDILVTDVRMPGMTGLELLLEARSVAPRLPVIVITAYGSPELRAQLRNRASVEYLEKPFSFPTLLATIDRALVSHTGFSGAVSLPMLPDLIQMYALSRVTGALRISRGTELGRIWFEGGEIVHATCGEISGPEAFYRLLTWEGGSFGLEAGVVAPQRTIHDSWQELLMEGCRLLDEQQRDAGERDPFPGMVPQPADTDEELLPELPEEKALDLEALASNPLWKRLAPRLEAASLGLVLACRPSGGRALVVRGSGESGNWGPALAGAASAARALAAGAACGVLECAGPGKSLAIFWSTRYGLLVGALDEGEGLVGVSRFRANVARWWEACEGRAEVERSAPPAEISASASPLDAICREAVTRLEGARACAVIDLDTGRFVAGHDPLRPASGLSDEAGVATAALFRGAGLQVDLQEIQVTCAPHLHFGKRVRPGVAVLLATDPDTNLGKGWARVKTAAHALEALM